MKKLTIFVLSLVYLCLFSQIFAQAPVVTDPIDQTVTEGEPATFSITVLSGTEPYSYQWQVSFDQANFVDVAGTNSSSYTTPDTDMSLNGAWFRCEVSNDSGVTFSNHAVLTVNAAPPVITMQPTDQNVIVGQTATFSVSATGSGTLTYQWYENGNPISGATSSSYTTDPIPDDTYNGATYYCIVTNSGGSTASDVAVLYVSYLNERVTDGLQVLYNFNEGSGNTVQDVSAVGSPMNLTIDNSSEVIWSPNGLYANLSNPIHSSSPATKIIDACTATNEITMEAWVVPANTSQGNSGPVRVLTLSENSANRNFALGQETDSWDARLRTTTTSDNGVPSLNSGSGTLETTLSHVVYTRESSGTAKIYVNGNLLQTTTVDGNFSNWNSAYLFGLGDEFNSDKTWEGLFYLTAVYSKALSDAEVTQNYLFGVDYDNKPFIVANPLNQSVLLGQTATFSVEAIGEGTFSYQWQKNGSNISGANSSNYTTPVTTLADNETTYRCIVSNANGSTTSSSATLFVAPSDSRITNGQIVLYRFEQGSGTVISDVSGSGTPLNLSILTPEAVEWTNSGLKIISPANIISDVAASKIVDACKLTNEITVEVWVKPANSLQNGPARILTNSLDKSARNFTLGQEFDDYQVGVRTSITDDGGISTNSGDGGAIPELTHVVFTRSAAGVVKIFVNGVEKVKNGGATGDLSTWNSNYRLAVANELLDPRPYLGLLNMIAVFQRQLQRSEIEHNYSIGVTQVNSPSNLLASSSVIRQVSLNWTDNSTNEDGFIIERASGTPLVYGVIDTVDESITNYLDENLLDGKNYVYRVMAFNEIVSSQYSNIDSVQALIPAPSDLEAEAIVIGEINLIWSDNSNNEDGFNIERAVNNGGAPEFSLVGTVGTNTESYIDESVDEGIEYIFRVVAVVGSAKSGSSNSVMLYSKASFINKPIDLIISLDEIRGIPILEWVDDSFNEDGFVIERRTASVGSSFAPIDSVGRNDTTFTDISVSDSTSYIYRIYAFNDDNNSDYSSEVFVDVLVDVESDIVIDRYNLTQNYPNPFNPTTTIKFDLPEAAQVTMTIYNLLGQQVLEAFDRNYSAGRHEFNFDGSSLTSGIYIYSLTANGVDGNNYISTKKMILLK